MVFRFGKVPMQQIENDFDKILPHEIKGVSVRSGNECVIPFPKVREAIELASQHLIAVLGVEVFHILPSGLGTEGYSGYELKFNGNWTDFVSQNNESATNYIDQHRFDEGYGYILTTASEKEFAHLRDHLNAKQ